MFGAQVFVVSFALFGVCFNVSFGRQMMARCMWSKCTVEKLNSEIRRQGDTDGLLKVVSWKVDRLDARTICKYLSPLDPTVIGLQRVRYRQFLQLKRTCLRYYNASGVPKRLSLHRMFNPIFTKQKQTIKEVNSGTYRSMTWSRVIFRANRGGRFRRGVFSESLLAILSGQKRMRKYSRRMARRFFQKQIFFTNIDALEHDNSKTFGKQLQHLYYNVMNRRRYRVILFGNVGWNRTLHKLENFVRSRDRRTGRYFTLFSNALPHTRQMQKLTNQMWITNQRSRDFRAVLSAVVETYTDNRPTFSLFLV